MAIKLVRSLSEEQAKALINFIRAFLDNEIKKNLQNVNIKCLYNKPAPIITDRRGFWYLLRVLSGFYLPFIAAYSAL